MSTNLEYFHRRFDRKSDANLNRRMAIYASIGKALRFVEAAELTTLVVVAVPGGQALTVPFAAIDIAAFGVTKLVQRYFNGKAERIANYMARRGRDTEMAQAVREASFNRQKIIRRALPWSGTIIGAGAAGGAAAGYAFGWAIDSAVGSLIGVSIPPVAEVIHSILWAIPGAGFAGIPALIPYYIALHKELKVPVFSTAREQFRSGRR